MVRDEDERQEIRRSPESGQQSEISPNLGTEAHSMNRTLTGAPTLASGPTGDSEPLV